MSTINNRKEYCQTLDRLMKKERDGVPLTKTDQENLAEIELMAYTRDPIAEEAGTCGWTPKPTPPPPPPKALSRSFEADFSGQIATLEAALKELPTSAGSVEGIDKLARATDELLKELAAKTDDNFSTGELFRYAQELRGKIGIARALSDPKKSSWTPPLPSSATSTRWGPP